MSLRDLVIYPWARRVCRLVIRNNIDVAKPITFASGVGIAVGHSSPWLVNKVYHVLTGDFMGSDDDASL